MSIASTLGRGASQVSEAAKGVTGYVTHTAGRIGNATGATGAFKSIAESSAGQFVGRHKVAAGAVAAATVAGVAYNAGGNHREKLLNKRAAEQAQGKQL